MKKSRIGITLGICLAVILSSCLTVWGQAGFNDDRVMLQGFYWESYRHGYPDKFPQFGPKKWYAIVKDQAGKIREGRFDLIWLPPPSYAGEFSVQIVADKIKEGLEIGVPGVLCDLFAGIVEAG